MVSKVDYHPWDTAGSPLVMPHTYLGGLVFGTLNPCFRANVSSASIAPPLPAHRSRKDAILHGLCNAVRHKRRALVRYA